VVVVGGSAGSLVPLRQFVAALPAELSGAVVITIHIAEQARSRLPSILERAGPLPAAHAETGEQVRPGRIYVAPPGCHLLMPGGTVELSNGPRINHTRPAVDAMFASAARWYGDRVVAVMLSGLLDDGAVGSALIEQAGGLVVAQDPQEAARPSMPEAALAAAPSAIAAPGARLGEIVAGMLGETGLVSWPRQQPRQPAEVSMEQSSSSPTERRVLPGWHARNAAVRWPRSRCRISPATAAASVTSSARSPSLSPRKRRPRGSCGALWPRWRRRRYSHGTSLLIRMPEARLPTSATPP
jgi:two-component system chemotaxis response regulator CheB